MVVAAVFGGALAVAFVILVAVLAKTSSNTRRGYSRSDGSMVMFGSGGCDSGSASDGGCGDGGGGGGGGGD